MTPEGPSRPCQGCWGQEGGISPVPRLTFLLSLLSHIPPQPLHFMTPQRAVLFRRNVGCLCSPAVGERGHRLQVAGRPSLHPVSLSKRHLYSAYGTFSVQVVVLESDRNVCVGGSVC